ncbi:hypothetical protein CPB84DRAFT_1744207 [Gymnopilus junonius]|uniref:Uncharacterized protein n=1 Tax=Gymnopilus junonius TaxID=109634 RepID=A0A9P5NVZ5_GYMJU|nr:hypothetical protein CPB84DRAFT_1744207 [Gymnopilus junonius]
MARHSDEDTSFIHSIPSGTLEEFRAAMYRDSYIRNNPAKFLDTAWVDIDELKNFLHSQKNASLTLKRDLNETDVIKEARIDTSSALDAIIKPEPTDVTLPSACTTPASRPTYQTITENGKEVLEILESDSDGEAMEIVKHVDDEDKGMSSDMLVDSFDVKMDSDSDSDMDDLDPYADHRMSCSSSGSDSSGSDSDSDSDFAPSKWLDKEVTSTVEVGLFKITREVTVDCIEYLSALPSYWPVPRDNHAYLIDLSSPKFDLKDKHGKLLPVDTLIKNADQDSWKGCTGGGVKDSHPLTTIFSTSDDDEPICCRRSRLKCRGCSACEKVNPEMLSQERYEPDANILESIIKLQFETRSKEADSAEKLALIFFAICHSITCPAKNKQGEKCDGIPILQKFTNGPQHGHKYFIGCSKWTKETRHDHSYSFIPNGVHDKDLDVLFKGGFLQDSGFLCGRIFPAHIGAKASHCKFPHNGNGTKAKVKQYKCPASRTIFVPEDPTIRKACFVPNYKQPHNHPVLPPSKTPLLVKEAYKACIEKVGLIGATVRTIDNAPTTRLAREEDPSLLAAPLQNQHVKQDIIRALKKAEFPEGMNLAGVIRVLQEDLKKPLRERYIHGFTQGGPGP